MKFFLIVIFLIFVGCNQQPTPKPQPIKKVKSPPKTNYNLKIVTKKVHYLVDSKFMPLYYNDKDLLDIGRYCNYSCSRDWPFFYAPLNNKDFKIISTPIKDMPKQLVFRHHPLYKFFYDVKPTDIKGEGVDGIWHLIKGVKIYNKFVRPSTFTINVKLLATKNNKTLYYNQLDFANKSNCSSKCLKVFKPFYTKLKNLPKGINKSDFTKIITRWDKQLVYKGHPLYTYIDDKNLSIKAQFKDGIWHMVEIK